MKRNEVIYYNRKNRKNYILRKTGNIEKGSNLLLRELKQTPKAVISNLLMSNVRVRKFEWQ